MKKARFSEEKIIAILKEAEAGVKTARSAASTASARPLCTTGRHAVEGWTPRSCDERRELENENARLKMYAELSRTHHALQDALQKKL